MSERLEDQIRRQTEAMYRQARPFTNLLPGELAEELGLKEEKDQHIASLRPRQSRTGTPGWVFGLGAALAVFLVVIPTAIWLNGSRQRAAVPTSSPEVVIDASGTVEMVSEGTDIGVVRFTVMALGGESNGGSNDPLMERSAIGHVEIAPPATTGDQWLVEGPVVCVLDLSPFSSAIDSEGVWEVRFVATDSTRAGLQVSEYASIYLRHSATGDMVGMLLGDPDKKSQSCGPRGDIQMRPLDSGGVIISQ